MKYIMIYCTTSDEDSALKIANELVNKKLVACCNIIPAITSVYNWQNKVNTDAEVLMIMKTKSTLFKLVEQGIKKLHDYEVPEIISTEITDGSEDYLNWIDEQTI